MAELAVGDQVFTDTGFATRVKDATPVLLGRPCREVVFSDGSVIVADASHLWETVSKRDRKRGYASALRTTDEVAGSLRVRHEYNHQVALAGPLQYGEQQLPIEPYVFGVWLGDGTSTAAEITTADQEVVANISSAGTTVVTRRPARWATGSAVRVTRGVRRPAATSATDPFRAGSETSVCTVASTSRSASCGRRFVSGSPSSMG